jgi:hypothetical protein
MLMSIAVVAAGSARAAPEQQSERATVVLLVHPPAAPPTVMQALIHLRGELDAAGFSARILEVPIGPDVRISLEGAAPGGQAVAVVAVLPVTDDEAGGETSRSAAAEVWVVDRVTGKTVVRRARAEADPSRAAEILSVRAVELLRASFVELAIMAQQPPAAAAPGAQAATRWVATTIEERQRPWTYGLELGGSILTSLGGVGPAVLPLIRLERAFGAAALLRLSGAGLGAPVHVVTPSGAADVTQDLALAEGVWRFRAGHHVQPLVSLGAGVLRLAADGHASAPYQGTSGTRWSAVLDAGAGARFSIHRRLEVAVEVHALGAEPYPTIRAFGTDAARAGRPSILAGITVVGGL